MKKVIEINKYQLCDLWFFLDDEGIKVQGEAYCTAIYLESNNPSYAHVSWSSTCTTETFEKIIKMINSLIVSNHELVFKEV